MYIYATILRISAKFFKHISRLPAIVALLSRDIRLLRHSHECSLVSFSLVRQSRLTTLRMSIRFIFRQIVTSCLHVFSILSRDCRTTFVRVSQNCRIVNSPEFRGERFETLARTSYDCRLTVARQSCDGFTNIFDEKNWI